eukprot:TRINITY_DN45006_c0_g1_i1.p1 TRINITY_DN45006_c0_g1~~TRINITY_DN45006_c0_g1_i1.p1  ORF type:complete len:331 (+),score=68.36 TRINITY_DN45006_c0_g1_i1:73-1065(+)
MDAAGTACSALPKEGGVVAGSAAQEPAESAEPSQRASDEPQHEPGGANIYWRILRRWTMGCAPGADESSSGFVETLGVQAHSSVVQGCVAAHACASGPGDGEPCRRRGLTCCLEDENEDGLFAPCCVCLSKAASVVEVPCGHVNVCVDCFQDYKDFGRCLRCLQVVILRHDVAPMLDPVTGRPPSCSACSTDVADVLVLPCLHMNVCERCLLLKLGGAPCTTCEKSVQQVCMVLWSQAGFRAPPRPRTSSTASQQQINAKVASTREPLHAYARDAPVSQQDHVPTLQRDASDVEDEIARLELILQNLQAPPPPRRLGIAASAPAPRLGSP